MSLLEGIGKYDDADAEVFHNAKLFLSNYRNLLRTCYSIMERIDGFFCGCDCLDKKSKLDDEDFYQLGEIKSFIQAGLDAKIEFAADYALLVNYFLRLDYIANRLVLLAEAMTLLRDGSPQQRMYYDAVYLRYMDMDYSTPSSITDDVISVKLHCDRSMYKRYISKGIDEIQKTLWASLESLEISPELQYQLRISIYELFKNNSDDKTALVQAFENLFENIRVIFDANFNKKI